MPSQNIKLGKLAETEAANFLKKSGYKIIHLNYKNKLGEIDIIARDKDTICFVEVKSRSSSRFGLPQEAVSRIKQLKISKVALSFLKEEGLLDSRARFDVVSVDYSACAGKLDLIKNAFELTGGYSY